MGAIVVNGESVSPNSIEQERRQLISELRLENTGISDDRIRLFILDRAKQNVIDHYLLKQEAERRKLPVDESRVEEQLNTLTERNGGRAQLEHYLSEIGETLDDFREHIRNRMLVDKLVEQIYDDVSEPKERHLKRYYKEHRELFNAEEKVRLEQIVKTFSNPIEKRKAKAEIEKIAEMIRSGKSFILMVKQRSDVPQNDGQLGWIVRGQLDKAFEDFAFSSEADAVSEPIVGAKAWYLLRVAEKQAPVQKSFEEVRSEIAQLLWNEERQEALNATLEKLRKKAVIKE